MTGLWRWLRKVVRPHRFRAEAAAEEAVQAEQSADRAAARAEANKRLDPEVNWLAAQLRPLADPDVFARMLRESFGDRR